MLGLFIFINIISAIFNFLLIIAICYVYVYDFHVVVFLIFTIFYSFLLILIVSYFSVEIMKFCSYMDINIIYDEKTTIELRSISDSEVIKIENNEYINNFSFASKRINIKNNNYTGSVFKVDFSNISAEEINLTGKIYIEGNISTRTNKINMDISGELPNYSGFLEICKVKNLTLNIKDIEYLTKEYKKSLLIRISNKINTVITYNGKSYRKKDDLNYLLKNMLNENTIP